MRPGNKSRRESVLAAASSSSGGESVIRTKAHLAVVLWLDRQLSHDSSHCIGSVGLPSERGRASTTGDDGANIHTARLLVASRGWSCPVKWCKSVTLACWRSSMTKEISVCRTPIRLHEVCFTHKTKIQGDQTPHGRGGHLPQPGRHPQAHRRGVGRAAQRSGRSPAAASLHLFWMCSPQTASRTGCCCPQAQPDHIARMTLLHHLTGRDPLLSAPFCE